MYILGISAFYHDSAAALIKDGRILYAAEEERFSRIKHDNGFPFKAAEFCLKAAGVSANDIDYVAYYEKPLLKFERIIENFVRTYPFSLKPFLKSLPEWLGDKIKVEYVIRKKLGLGGKVLFIPHHLSHAAAAFYPSQFSTSAILTVDGIGEYQTTGLWLGKENAITPLARIDFPHSLGLLYAAFTAFLGFRVNEDEYKVMGLAAYGKPTYAEKIYRTVSVKDDGSFRMDMRYFSFREQFRMWSRDFEGLFGQSRLPHEPIEERHKNLAASIQAVTEDIYFKMLNHLHGLTGTKSVCIGGGVALNALANGKIYQKTPFRQVHILGPAGDSGGAIGTALFAYHHILYGNPRHAVNDLCLGQSYDNQGIEAVLKKYGLSYKKFSDEDALLGEAARRLSENNVLGWFQGRMEFGPRALGSRSILANPEPRFMKERVNKIKIREQFRPFAGSVLQERAHEYFEVPDEKHSSPFMTFCFQTRQGKKQDIAAIVHEDGTCRIQTVNQECGRYYKLIKAFGALTGIPCLLNTSFNLKGEPIVENPEQAVCDFLKTEMDHLVIGDFMASKD